ncbi:MAG: glycosyltransferase family 2 protein [Candidatus Omnitrophica bacterium]|jgi:hypothetical protein|nr:glycosyltransferase family 2 protein [Candidatus Omnitrophota bacterium]
MDSDIIIKPVLSLFGPSIRPHLWMHLYESVSQATTLPFEIIFCGPIAPTFDLPHNLIYIKTANIKLIQCWQIGAMHTKGDVISLVADDLIFSPGALDEAYSIYTQKNDYKAIIALRMFLRGADQTHTCKIPRYVDTNKRTMLIPGGLSLISRKFFMELGGFDKSFIYCDANFDLFIRAFYAGGSYFWCKEGHSDEDVGWAAKTYNTTWGHWGHQDTNLLKSLWSDNDNLRETRSMPFESFVMDESIYQVSQGNNVPNKWV